ncbi:unnamed protein product [Periconia digitata]|uniref:PAC domain-containing protein n=1 Tax=Periconia digitata TaxID=1303443 RepID=A0A9W4XWF3_9PLEO|nr:unnamed protein product [Periconia digitata]
MPLLNKIKRRSGGGHGIFSSSHITAVSEPTHLIKISGMGHIQAPDNIPRSNRGGNQDIGHEPLFDPLQQMHQVPDDDPQIRKLTSFSQLASADRTSKNEPLGSHPTQPVSYAEEETAPSPPDFTRRGIHIPTRTSSSPAVKKQFLRPTSERSRSRVGRSESGSHHAQSIASDTDSVKSYETKASSTGTAALIPLQYNQTAEPVDRMSPLLEDDPRSFDLIASAPSDSDRGPRFNLETQSQLLFSKEHLQAIFDHPASLLRFTTFLNAARPRSVPILVYYLDALKALRAVNYANAIAEALDPIEGLEFTTTSARPTVNAILEDKAKQAFDVLVREDLPAFISHVFVQVVSVSIQKRVTGSLPPMLREASEGLAEVFCLTDPSRTDNPIIFASEEFHRTTQYGVGYAIGRNCRFLQGPWTSKSSVERLKRSVVEGREINEVLLNYRRDGSPFMNLLMMAPLIDSRGNTRYYIGAQIDVSGLVKDSTDLEALQRLIAIKEGREAPNPPKDELQDLSEMLNNAELETVRRHGGSMHHPHLEEQDDGMSSREHRPRVLIKGMTEYEDLERGPDGAHLRAEGRLAGVYKNYLIIRPAPSLRILFVSPPLRIPGILQSRFLDRIGGSDRVRDSLSEALADGTRGVTAKVRWLSSASATVDPERPEGRPRWIHCTPLLGSSGAVGVWMVVLVDDDKASSTPRRFRQAPPVADTRRSQQHQHQPQPQQRGRRHDSSHLESNHDFDSLRAGSRNGSKHPSRHNSPGGGGRSRSGLREGLLQQQVQQQRQRSFSPALQKSDRTAEPNPPTDSGCDEDDPRSMRCSTIVEGSADDTDNNAPPSEIVRTTEIVVEKTRDSHDSSGESGETGDFESPVTAMATAAVVARPEPVEVPVQNEGELAQSSAATSALTLEVLKDVRDFRKFLGR